ncbi:MAG TPA: carboxypeptidase M32, partial [Tepidisphaeraceae bacterium]|nr:carboxypeptidase M32 [Tepidisphaeraceae bacterium]
EAEYVGYQNSPYDALLDTFEPYATTEEIATALGDLKNFLAPFLVKIKNSKVKINREVIAGNFDIEKQKAFCTMVAAKIGYDFDAGRLNVSAHPFSTSFHPLDARITTRYSASEFMQSISGVVHETGHALYEQGLPQEHYGTPLGGAISLGIHESQSRMWENLVGRDRAFWRHFLPLARQTFAEPLQGVTDEQWYFAINDIRPSLIRTEADEATYNLHVLLRFEIEQALLNDQLKPADLPEAWNQKMRQYLGVVPPDDARGCLQDIHWSGGAIGYFPTYTLGNLYAAQFFEQAATDIPGLDESFSRGDFAPLLGWLREKIHRHGKRFRAGELVRRVTGQDLSAEPLLRHLKRKGELYGVS